MYYEIHDAYDEGCEDERRNGLNSNASSRKVNMIRENGQEKQDERVHDDESEAERQDDETTEQERKDGLQYPVQQRENEGNDGDLDGSRPGEDVDVQDEPRYEAIRDPECERVARDGQNDAEYPVHGFIIAQSQ